MIYDYFKIFMVRIFRFVSCVSKMFQESTGEICPPVSWNILVVTIYSRRCDTDSMISNRVFQQLEVLHRQRRNRFPRLRTLKWDRCKRKDGRGVGFISIQLLYRIYVNAMNYSRLMRSL